MEVVAYWDEILDWMVEEHGMNEIVGDERTLILDYLAAHYNEDEVRQLHKVLHRELANLWGFVSRTRPGPRRVADGGVQRAS